MDYKKSVRRRQMVQLVLVIVCIAAISAYFLFVTRPVITGHAVRDECGPIGGTISHSINDKDECINVCRAYCLSLKDEYYDVNFELLNEKCNSCECFCKKERFK